MFIINVYKDQYLLSRLLPQIKKHFDKKIVVIGDGVKLDNCCKKETTWFECERIKTEGKKGLWTKRYLEYYLQESDDPFVVKLDPDTCVWRSFTIPDGDICGNIGHKYKHPYVKGGCIAIKREAATKMLESKLLEDECYASFNYERYGKHKWLHETRSSELLALQDWIVGDIAYRLNLKLQEWDEIKILGNDNIKPVPENFAVTHPHPTNKSFHLLISGQ